YNVEAAFDLGDLFDGRRKRALCMEFAQKLLGQPADIAIREAAHTKSNRSAPSYDFHQLIELLRRDLSSPEGPEQHWQPPDKILVSLQVGGNLAARRRSPIEKLHPFVPTLFEAERLCVFAQLLRRLGRRKYSSLQPADIPRVVVVRLAEPTQGPSLLRSQ